jgi:DNA polymerase
MSLDLDDRQRAMLAEMGVHVWWPQTPALEQLDAVVLQAESDQQDAIENIATRANHTEATGQYPVDSPVPTTAEVATPNMPPVAAVLVEGGAPSHPPVARKLGRTPQPSPAELLPLPNGIADMDWPALGAAVSACQACHMCLGRVAPVLATLPGTVHADWLVVGDPPDDAQERAGQPFVDDAGKLLDNMLRAVGVCRYSPDEVPGRDVTKTAYLTSVLKCRPVLPTAPNAQAMATCAHYLRREIALVQPKIIVAMGRVAMQVLLSEDHPQGLKLPLGKLRGQVWHYQGVPVVVTYPPAYLLRAGQDKARAWEDLCLAMDVAQGHTAPA